MTLEGGDARSAVKILAAASGGGHWIQLNRLRAAFEGFDIVYVTTEAHLADMVKGARCLRVRDATRKNRLSLFITLCQAISIVLRERPQVIITTGALPGLMLLIAGKTLVGARTIWIDSIANPKKLSGSGKLARRFADTRLSQWPSVAQKENIECWGAVL